MAILTTDLITGKQYLLSGDFSDGTGTTVTWNLIADKPSWLSGTTLTAFETGHTHSQYADLTGASFIGDVGITGNLVFDSKTITGITTGTTDNNLLVTKGYVDSASGGIPYTGATQAVDLNSQTLNTTGTINSVYINVPATGAFNSNFLGSNAGANATSANNSNFLGQDAGCNAINAHNSNFLGCYAGFGATTSSDSNFFGNNAGRGTSTACYSNFIGNYAGYNAGNANHSTFIGRTAGYNASSAYYSNFIGRSAGYGASNAYYSNFIGCNTGCGASNASSSNFFGRNVGKSFTNNNVGSNNIIIGTNISLPDATTDSINIGGVLYGTGTYSTVAGDPSITPQSSGKIGIGIIPTTSMLEVAGDVSLNTNGCGLILYSSGGTAYCLTITDGGTLSINAV